MFDVRLSSCTLRRRTSNNEQPKIRPEGRTTNANANADKESRMFSLAERISQVSDSITLAVSAKAAALKKSGVDVVGFGAGEPDFDTPAFIKEAAKSALDK